VGGRVLILFTALLLAVTPWTEYLWHFDNFLHGGQDMELGLLSIVTIFWSCARAFAGRQAACNVHGRDPAMAVICF
jgi:hypothetical protein